MKRKPKYRWKWAHVNPAGEIICIYDSKEEASRTIGHWNIKRIKVSVDDLVEITDDDLDKMKEELKRSRRVSGERMRQRIQ